MITCVIKIKKKFRLVISEVLRSKNQTDPLGNMTCEAKALPTTCHRQKCHKSQSQVSLVQFHFKFKMHSKKHYCNLNICSLTGFTIDPRLLSYVLNSVNV